MGSGGIAPLTLNLSTGDHSIVTGDFQWRCSGRSVRIIFGGFVTQVYIDFSYLGKLFGQAQRTYQATHDITGRLTRCLTV